VSTRPGEREDPSPTKPQRDAFFRDLFEHYPEAMLVTEAQSNAILHVNQAACALLGMSRDELVGLDQARTYPSKHAAAYRSAFQERLGKSGMVTEDVVIQRPSGDLVPVRISAIALDVCGKRVVRWLLREIAGDVDGRDLGRPSDRLAALKAIAAAIAGPLSPHETMSSALDTVLEVMDLHAGTILLMDPDQGSIALTAHRGLSEELHRLLVTLLSGQRLADALRAGSDALLMDDLAQDPHLAPLARLLEDEGHRSVAAVPLITRGKGLGALLVASPTPDRFTRQDVELLDSIAIQVGIAVENAALHQQQRQRSSELEALHETTLDISRQLDLAQLLNSIVERASALAGTTAGGLYLYHPEEEELELVVSLHLDGDYCGTRLKLGEGLSGKVAQSGEPMVVEDYESWEGRSPKYEGISFRGVAAVPLKWGDQVLGVVNVTNLGEAWKFSRRDLQLLELFASQAAIAIQNARLYAKQEQRSQELMALYDTSLHITSRLDVDNVLQAITVRAAKLLDALTSEVYLNYPAEGNLKSAAASGLWPELEGSVLQPGEGVAGRVLQTGEPLIVDDYDSWTGQAPRYAGYGFARVVGVPIKYGPELLGVLIVDRPLDKPRFTYGDVNLLTLLANQAAIAIENARLHDQTKQRLEELSAVEEIVGEISSTLDLGKVMRTVLDKAVEATEASAGSIDIVADDRTHLEWLAHRGYPPHVAERYAHSSSTDKGIVGRVARTGQMALVDDISQDPDYLEVVPATRSQLTVPITIENAVAGVIVLESPKLGGFTPEHADFVQHLAEHAAIAMDNAQLYERLRKSEERYRAYVENVPDAIWEADAEGRFTYWSPQAESLTGYAPEELLDHAPDDILIHPDEASEFRERLARMVEEGRQEFTLRHRALRKDGSRIHLEFSVKPVWDDAGRVVKYGGVARDVSDQIRIQAQLIQSAKLSGIGEMISGVAHELNNPLTTVIGYTQLLQASDIDEDTRADLQKIYDGAVRAQRIVHNLLTFSRQTKPQRGPTDVNEVLEHSLTLRGYQLQVDDIEIDADLAENLPWTMADGYQLEQVFLNIINNAHQAMAQAAGRRVLTVRSTLANPGTIRITFADTGPGIPVEILDRIFDPFFTTKEVGVGTGLGLSVSHGIIQEHGGRIWGESPPGTGATFIIELPVRSWAEGIDVTPADDPLSPTAGERQRILVIDDEQDLLDLMVKTLADPGYLVEGVTSADSARSRLHHTRYDLVISDVTMPDWDARTCDREVKAVDPALSEHSIFVTEDAPDADTEAFLKARQGRCLRKPFALEELREAVRAVLDEGAIEEDSDSSSAQER
jgi:two-component system NtrC family sensor kinase